MLKVLGAILVISSSTAIGLFFSDLTRGRMKDLRDFKKNIFILRGDIQYGNTPLPEAIESLARRNNDNFKTFFSLVSSRLKCMDGSTFQEIWEECIINGLEESYLLKSDKEHMKQLGDNLGYLDKEMQIKTIDLYLEQLEQEITESYEKMKDKVRLYNLVGILFGIFITIVMI